ncbi:MAG: MvdC/MvdD family ATP grasp protein [Bryobacteraceae bacterium]
MNHNILIVGHTFDPHIEKVASFLRLWGSRVVIFDRFAHGSKLSLSISKNGVGGYVKTSECSISFEDVDAVWWRLKPMIINEITGVFTQASEEFASREWRMAIRSLPYFCDHALWVNPLVSQHEINFKPYQLRLAHEVGFQTPTSFFTNDPEAVLKLFSTFDEVVYKTLGWCIFPPDEVIYTSKVSREMVDESREGIGKAPGIFQQFIRKKSELRVTVVGDEVFAVSIDSAKHSTATVDWRKAQFEDMFSKTDMDAKDEAKLLAFHNRAGLQFGAYDFIVSERGDLIFLECNPSGQWLWIEEKINLPIAERHARLLFNGAKAVSCRSGP